MHRVEGIALAAFVMVGFITPLAVPSEAHAICDAPRTKYVIGRSRKVWKLSNLIGDWTEHGIQTKYVREKVGSVSGSISAGLSVEAGVIFAKASTTLSTTWGKTWTRGDKWEIQGPPVPRGKLGRLVMYHEMRSLSVAKQSLRSPCKYVTVKNGR